MVLFFVLFALVAALVERWSIKHALDGVRHEIKLSRELIEPDEKFEMITTIRNTSFRFIPFIRMSEDVPRTLETGDDILDTGFDDSRAKINSTVYMMPRQKVTRRITASLGARGRYAFPGATLYGGDFLGLAERSRYYVSSCEAVVFPKRCDIPNFSETLGGFLGDISVNRFILEDPVLNLGFREYTGREPMKQISWPVTARTGRMMVKNYDHTLDITVTVVLNIQTKLFGYASHPLIEKCYEMTRSVCEALEEKHITYAFCTNALAVDLTGAWEYVSDGLGGVHLAGILEGLGRATYATRGRADELIDSARRRAESGRAHIVITPTEFDFAPGEIESLRNYTGAQVLVLQAREGGADNE